MKKSNPCRLVSQCVEDSQGNILPGGPGDYPEIVGRAKALILSLETGDEHVYDAYTNTITRYKKSKNCTQIVSSINLTQDSI